MYYLEKNIAANFILKFQIWCNRSISSFKAI